MQRWQFWLREKSVQLFASIVRWSAFRQVSWKQMTKNDHFHKDHCISILKDVTCFRRSHLISRTACYLILFTIKLLTAVGVPQATTIFTSFLKTVIKNCSSGIYYNKECQRPSPSMARKKYFSPTLDEQKSPRIATKFQVCKGLPKLNTLLNQQEILVCTPKNMIFNFSKRWVV